MESRVYFRPLPIGDPDLHEIASRQLVEAGSPSPAPLAGGPLSFLSVEAIARRGAEINRGISPLATIKADAADWLRTTSAARPPIADIPFDRPRVMAVINATPDSFSDGGAFLDPGRAIEHGLAMAAAGADILDIGGESTRPGAELISLDEERARVLPIIKGLVEAGCDAPISIDTRKAAVARDAFAAGARLFNDVSALTFDPESLVAAAELCAEDQQAGVVLCHALGEPKTMQQAPRYHDVVLDVYDALEARLAACVEAGVPEDRLILDPGIGFGKTLEHNVALIRGLATFHGLGRPILLGVSRKRFIGTLTGVESAADRGPGSIAGVLMGVAKGAQIIRAHDVAETVQALAVWRALTINE